METCSTRRQRTASLLAAVIAVHKEHRSLLHSGGARRFDHANPAVLAHGVVATDGSEALVSFATVTAPASLVIEPFRITGLDRIRVLHPENMAHPLALAAITEWGNKPTTKRVGHVINSGGGVSAPRR